MRSVSDDGDCAAYSNHVGICHLHDDDDLMTYLRVNQLLQVSGDDYNDYHDYFADDGDDDRPAQLAELPRSKFDPKLFPHSSYVKICETFATNVPYLTFCNIM